MFSDGSKVYKNFDKKYKKHKKGFVIFGPPGIGKTTFVKNQTSKKKEWIDQDELFHDLGVNWKLDENNNFKLNYMRADYMSEQSKKLGYRIIGSLFWEYIPDAIVIPPLEIHKKYISNRKDLKYNNVIKIRKFLFRHAKKNNEEDKEDKEDKVEVIPEKKDRINEDNFEELEENKLDKDKELKEDKQDDLKDEKQENELKEEKEDINEEKLIGQDIIPDPEEKDQQELENKNIKEEKKEEDQKIDMMDNQDNVLIPDSKDDNKNNKIETKSIKKDNTVKTKEPSINLGASLSLSKQRASNITNSLRVSIGNIRSAIKEVTGNIITGVGISKSKTKSNISEKTIPQQISLEGLDGAFDILEYFGNFAEKYNLSSEKRQDLISRALQGARNNPPLQSIPFNITSSSIDPILPQNNLPKQNSRAMLPPIFKTTGNKQQSKSKPNLSVVNQTSKSKKVLFSKQVDEDEDSTEQKLDLPSGSKKTEKSVKSASLPASLKALMKALQVKVKNPEMVGSNVKRAMSEENESAEDSFGNPFIPLHVSSLINNVTSMYVTGILNASHCGSTGDDMPSIKNYPNIIQSISKGEITREAKKILIYFLKLCFMMKFKQSKPLIKVDIGEVKNISAEELNVLFYGLEICLLYRFSFPYNLLWSQFSEDELIEITGDKDIKDLTFLIPGELNLDDRLLTGFQEILERVQVNKINGISLSQPKKPSDMGIVCKSKNALTLENLEKVYSSTQSNRSFYSDFNIEKPSSIPRPSYIAPGCRNIINNACLSLNTFLMKALEDKLDSSNPESEIWKNVIKYLSYCPDSSIQDAMTQCALSTGLKDLARWVQTTHFKEGSNALLDKFIFYEGKVKPQFTIPPSGNSDLSMYNGSKITLRVGLRERCQYWIEEITDLGNGNTLQANNVYKGVLSMMSDLVRNLRENSKIIWNGLAKMSGTGSPFSRIVNVILLKGIGDIMQEENTCVEGGGLIGIPKGGWLKSDSNKYLPVTATNMGFGNYTEPSSNDDISSYNKSSWYGYPNKGSSFKKVGERVINGKIAPGILFPPPISMFINPDKLSDSQSEDSLDAVKIFFSGDRPSGCRVVHTYLNANLSLDDYSMCKGVNKLGGGGYLKAGTGINKDKIETDTLMFVLGPKLLKYPSLESQSYGGKKKSKSKAKKFLFLY